MLAAVISDIHAFPEPLKRCLDKIDAARADEIWCLGDIVGYGKSPLSCVELVRERCSVSIMGNHEAWAIEADLSLFAGSAQRGLLLAREYVRAVPEAWQWMCNLPIEVERDGWTLLHGGWFDRLFGTTEPAEIGPDFRVLCGHTHRPGITTSREFSPPPGGWYRVRSGVTLNPGTVAGLGPAGGTWMLLDTEGQRARWYGVL